MAYRVPTNQRKSIYDKKKSQLLPRSKNMKVIDTTYILLYQPTSVFMQLQLKIQAYP
ncbi:hypothetical protein LEMLEM_LOCUS7658 [Lemmus lemmus]